MTTPAGRPVREIILKVRSRCNIACDYCYVYELADTGWKNQPVAMTSEIATLIAKRCAEYGPDRLQVIFHGGEALLGGAEPLAEIAGLFSDAMPDIPLAFGAQTNGTLLDESGLRILREAGISLGVSLDGTKIANDRHRMDKRGQSTYDQVIAALDLLASSYRDIFGGVLAVTDLTNDPAETYWHLAHWNPPLLGFLWPLATHDSPPPGSGGSYGKWFADVFDIWQSQPADRAPDMRFFRIIIERLLGRDVRSGFIGPEPYSQSIVFQPDGSAELLDSLAVVGDRAAVTGMNVTSSTLAEIADYSGYQQPVPAMICRPCSVFSSCGGGYWPTRHSMARGYDNPSVYCPDLMYLINHIADAVDHQRELLKDEHANCS